MEFSSNNLERSVVVVYVLLGYEISGLSIVSTFLPASPLAIMPLKCFHWNLGLENRTGRHSKPAIQYTQFLFFS